MTVLGIVVVVMTLLVTVVIVGTVIVAAMLSVGVLVFEFVFCTQSGIRRADDERAPRIYPYKRSPPDYTRIKILRRASAHAYRVDQCVENALLGKSLEE